MSKIKLIKDGISQGVLFFISAFITLPAITLMSFAGNKTDFNYSEAFAMLSKYSNEEITSMWLNLGYMALPILIILSVAFRILKAEVKIDTQED